MSALRVGFDVSAVRHGLDNGIAVYTASLARALLALPEPPEILAYFCARSSPAAEEVIADLERRGAEVVRGPGPWAWSPDGAWWLPGGPPLGGIRRRVDVFHVGDFHLPRPGAPPAVATIHDLTTVTHPDQHLWLNRLLHARRLRWARQHAARLIVPSRSTAGDAERILGLEAGRVAIVHEALRPDLARSGIHAEAVRRRYELEKPYILSVGTLEPRKNQARLIEAFSAVEDAGAELVLAGGDGWRTAEIHRAVSRSPARDRIRFLGRVPTSDLPGLYAGAVVFAYPSLYEGFGLPVLEAMAAGAPVLTSSVSSLPEVAGDAALLVDPRSTADIADGLGRLLHDPELRDRLSSAGRRRESAFTWERAARETLDVYHQAIDAPYRR